MVRLSSCQKNIACLESFWTYDVENRLSMAPVLDLLGKTNGTRFVVLSCNTFQELEFNLELIKKMRGYGILYLGFHGFAGGIYLPDMKIKMEMLAQLMGKRFRNWIVFFDSCSTLRVQKDRVFDFMAQTGVAMVMGYRRDVEWVNGAAMDLLVLNRLHQYKSMGRFWTHFKKAYKDLVEMTGLEVFLK